MTGRKENEEHYKNLSLKALEGYPKLLYNFYREGSGKQATSKHNWLLKILRMYDWLTEVEGLDLTINSAWQNVTRRNVKDYLLSLKDRGLSYATMISTYNALKKFFRYLEKEEVIKASPLPELGDIDSIISSEDNAEREATYMTPEEVGLVCKSIVEKSTEPKRDICIFKLGCRTGLRATALTEIDVEDVDFEKGLLYVIEKGKRYRQIILDPDTLNLIRECIQEREQRIAEWGRGSELKALFIKNYKERYGGVRRISKRYISHMIEYNTTMLDKHITPHKMRSTCITNTYNMTGDIYAAARKAGHKSLSNTKRYINTADKDRQIAEKLANLY